VRRRATEVGSNAKRGKLEREKHEKTRTQIFAEYSSQPEYVDYFVWDGKKIFQNICGLCN
jgi:hypothetical protein